MTTVEELCAEVVGRVERTICRGCGTTDIEIDRSGIGHVIAGSVPDQCGPVETVEDDQLCGHPEGEHAPPRQGRERPDGSPEPWHCSACCTLGISRDDTYEEPCMHVYRAPEAA